MFYFAQRCNVNSRGLLIRFMFRSDLVEWQVNHKHCLIHTETNFIAVNRGFIDDELLQNLLLRRKWFWNLITKTLSINYNELLSMILVSKWEKVVKKLIRFKVEWRRICDYYLEFEFTWNTWIQVQTYANQLNLLINCLWE